MASQADGEASTARLRLTALELLARWLAAEEGFDADPILAVKPPKLDQRSVADLSENEIARMLKACDGTALRDRRDKAVLVLAAETGLRAAELLALDVTHVDVVSCVLHVRRGKGGKGRRVKFSQGAAAILDRYLRCRRQSGYPAGEGPLWVSQRGRLSYTGLVHSLKPRATSAGVSGFHLHRLRHSAAVRWLRSGGTETGLMAHAGWTSNTMIGRWLCQDRQRTTGRRGVRPARPGALADPYLPQQCLH